MISLYTTLVLCVAGLLIAVSPVSAGMITGKIVSCDGERLDEFPELKSFLLDHEAEEYRNLEVEFVPGKKAILTVYHGDEVYEKIVLSDYKTKKAMHKLMGSKGFVRKTKWEINAMKEKKRSEL